MTALIYVSARPLRPESELKIRQNDLQQTPMAWSLS